jgi:5-methylcytosine-specific restriction endonuclease McrA
MPTIKRTRIGGKWIRPIKRELIYKRDGHTCVYCGRDLSRRMYRTLDHLIPVCRGGSNHSSNLVTCCLFCNTKKGDTDGYDFVTNDEARERIYNATRTPLKGYRERVSNVRGANNAARH